MAAEKNQGFFTKKLIITSLIAGILLVVVNSAVWVNRQLFDTENFTNTAVTSITSESSRKAIGARIVDELLQDKPAIKNVVGDRASNLIGGLLGTEQVRNILAAGMSRLQIYVTSNDQQDVDIDLTGLKSLLTRLIEVSGREGETKINPEEIPDKIVLIEEENIPDVYKFGVALSWFAVFGLFAIIVLLALPYIHNKKNYKPIMAVQGGFIVAIGLLSLLIGPLFKPPFLESFRNSNGRIVANNLYDAFINTFNSQTYILIGFGLLLCVIAGSIHVYPKVKAILKHK